MPKTIVSITPVALDRDSRTLKIAHSFSQWGYQSIVVEGQKSTVDFLKYGIEVISLAGPSEKSLSNHLIPSTNFVGRILKEIWFLLKQTRLTFFLHCVSFYRFRRKFYHQYIKGIDKKIPEADIYYLHSYEYFFAIKKKIKKNNAKLIYDAHDFYLELNPAISFFGSKYVKNFQRSIENQLINDSCLVFTVSKGLEMLYRNEYNVSPIVLRNAHSRHLDRNTHFSLKKHFALDPKSNIILHIGNCKEGQAANNVIKTFIDNSLKNYYLIFIGSGYEKIKNIISAEEQKKVLFVKYVDPTILVPVAKEADFGIISYFALVENYRFALPNRFFQMIAAQLPILFSKDLEEINGLNKIERFGLGTDFNDPTKLKKDFKNFLRNFSKKDALSAKQNLTWQNEENILRKEIQKLTECK